MAITFDPLGDRILIEVEPEPDLSPLLYVQKDHEDLARFAKILALGPEVRGLSVGQRILASVLAGTIMAQGTVITQQQVLGVIHE